MGPSVTLPEALLSSFPKYGGEEIEMDSKTLKIIQRSDILAVVEN